MIDEGIMNANEINRKTMIAVIMTVHNRSAMTKNCIESIIAASREVENTIVALTFYITDDGSVDNTTEELKFLSQHYTDSTFCILQGDGNLFWNRGMYKAYGEALSKKYDYYLFVNNDVLFKNTFLQVLLNDSDAASKISESFAVCGSCYYNNSSERSYGGDVILSRLTPFKKNKLKPNGEIQKCDLMNGNCIIIPYNTAMRVGNLDRRYEHGFGDYDYSFMIKKKRGQCFIASQYVGGCDRNNRENRWNNPKLPIREQLRRKNSPTGLPWRSELVFFMKWYPSTIVYHFFQPYYAMVRDRILWLLKNKDK